MSVNYGGEAPERELSRLVEEYDRLYGEVERTLGTYDRWDTASGPSTSEAESGIEDGLRRRREIMAEISDRGLLESREWTRLGSEGLKLGSRRADYGGSLGSGAEVLHLERISWAAMERGREARRLREALRSGEAYRERSVASRGVWRALKALCYVVVVALFPLAFMADPRLDPTPIGIAIGIGFAVLMALMLHAGVLWVEYKRAGSVPARAFKAFFDDDSRFLDSRRAITVDEPDPRYGKRGSRSSRSRRYAAHNDYDLLMPGIAGYAAGGGFDPGGPGGGPGDGGGFDGGGFGGGDGGGAGGM